jgi:uncharacterized protein (TIGR03437 family)
MHRIAAFLVVLSSVLAQPNPDCKLGQIAKPLTGIAATAPASMAVDANGRLLVAGTGTSQVYAVAADGSMTVIAGSGQAGFAGDGGPALASQFSNPNGVAQDAAGNIYVADSGNNRVRKIDRNGQVSTVAGSGSNDEPYAITGTPVSAKPPLEVPIYRPRQVAVDSRGNLYILSQATFGRYLFRLDATDGLLRLVYPRGPYGATLDSQLTAFAIGPKDVLVVAWRGPASPEEIGELVRILPDGTREPIPGAAGFFGVSTALAFDEAGNLYVAEATRLRRISPNSAINTLAGFATGFNIPAALYSGELNFTSGLLATGGNLILQNATFGIRSLGLGNCSTPVQPAIAMNGIVDASGMRSLPGVSPGELITIYGSSLGPATAVPGVYQNGTLGKEAGGTRVLFNGVPGPVLYASSGQVNAIVPFSISASACVSVEYNGTPSDNHCGSLYPATPGIFLIQNPDGSVNASTAAAPGGSVVTIWASGFGTFSPSLADGAIVSAAGSMTLPVKVTIGDVAAQVPYAGPAPGLVAGVVQLNVQVPAQSPASPSPARLAIQVGTAQLSTNIWLK